MPPKLYRTPSIQLLGVSRHLGLSALHTLYLYLAHRQSDRNNEFTLESAATLKYCPPQQEFMILAKQHYEISYPPINSYCVYLTRCTSAAAKSNKINYYVFVRLQTLVADEDSPASEVRMRLRVGLPTKFSAPCITQLHTPTRMELETHCTPNCMFC
jgi:hypothetical protein